MPARNSPQPEPDDSEQSRCLTETMREAGADEASEADTFQRVVRRLGETGKEPRRATGKASERG